MVLRPRAGKLRLHKGDIKTVLIKQVTKAVPLSPVRDHIDFFFAGNGVPPRFNREILFSLSRSLRNFSRFSALRHRL